jgi:hypothetical protein
MRTAAVLPVVGFEVERVTGGQAKHVKGSVSNLNSLGAQLSAVVIGKESVTLLKKQTKAFHPLSDKEVERVLLDRVNRWVFAESQPTGRFLVMSEGEVTAWATKHGVLAKKGAA